MEEEYKAIEDKNFYLVRTMLDRGGCFLIIDLYFDINTGRWATGFSTDSGEREVLKLHDASLGQQEIAKAEHKKILLDREGLQKLIAQAEQTARATA